MHSEPRARQRADYGAGLQFLGGPAIALFASRLSGNAEDYGEFIGSAPRKSASLFSVIFRCSVAKGLGDRFGAGESKQCAFVRWGNAE